MIQPKNQNSNYYEEKVLLGNLENKERSKQNNKSISSLSKIPHEESFIWQLTRVFYLGVLNSISFGDFIIINIFLELMINSGNQENIKSAFSYYSSVFEVLFFTFNYGMIETVGIYGSQAYGRGQYEKLTLYLYQGMFLSVCVYFMAFIPFYFISVDILSYYESDHFIVLEF